MAIPLILAFAGLLGARELEGNRRAGVRERKREQQADADRNVVGSLLGAGRGAFGRTGADAVGPLTPAGTRAHTDLNPNQVEYIKALSINNPGAAREEAAALVLSNQTQANTELQQQHNQADITQRRDAYNLNVQKHEDAQTELRLGRNATQQELEDGNRAMIDRQFGMAQAARAGAQTYGYAAPNAQGGTDIGLAHMPGTAAFNANQEAIEKGGDLLRNINEIRGTMHRVGLAVLADPSFATSRQVESQVTDVHLQLKEVANLGVLSGSDLELLLNQFPDPTSFTEFVVSNPGALDAAMAVVSGRIENALESTVNESVHWGGIDNQANARAFANIQGAQALNQQSAQVVQAEQAGLTRRSNIDNLARIGGGNASALSLAERRAALLEFGADQSGVIDPSRAGSIERQATRAIGNAPGAALGAVGGFLTRGLIR